MLMAATCRTTEQEATSSPNPGRPAPMLTSDTRAPRRCQRRQRQLLATTIAPGVDEPSWLHYTQVSCVAVRMPAAAAWVCL